MRKRALEAPAFGAANGIPLIILHCFLDTALAERGE
jgi:hypothetical protein